MYSLSVLHQGPVFQNGVRPGVSLNLTKSAIALFGVKLVGTKYTLKSTPA